VLLFYHWLSRDLGETIVQAAELIVIIAAEQSGQVAHLAGLG
jgi:hypothetical protein